MRKRDDTKNRRDTMHALTMILQIGLAVMTCMGMSLAIGYYIDKLFMTTIWVPIMMVIGIMAAIRSMLVLAGKFTPKESGQGILGGEEQSPGLREKGKDDADSEEKPD